MFATTSQASFTNPRTCFGFIATSGPITSRTSPPLQKPRPAPVSTTARTDRSFLRPAKESRSAA
jgi:hypothetical protein